MTLVRVIGSSGDCFFDFSDALRALEGADRFALPVVVEEGVGLVPVPVHRDAFPRLYMQLAIAAQRALCLDMMVSTTARNSRPIAFVISTGVVVIVA